MLKLFLVRGLPGSGKSTFGKTLAERNAAEQFEADMFFSLSGTYAFEPNCIAQAHHWCQEQTRRALSHGINVVVSNTFVKKWEIQPYLEMAKEVGAVVIIHTMKGEYGSIHGVPGDVLARMKDDWED